MLNSVQPAAMPGEKQARNTSSSPMSRFGCLDCHQPESSKPSLFYSKSEAFLMIRRGQVDRIGPRLIKRRSHADYVKPPNPLPDKTPLPAGRTEIFLDGKLIAREGLGLAPREVPGVTFKLPESYQWKMDHAFVRFL